MSVALIVVGVLAVLAAVPMGVVAAVQRVRSHRSKPTARATAGLAAGGLVLLIVGASIAAASPQTTTTAITPATPNEVPSTASTTPTASATPTTATTTAPTTPVPTPTTSTPAATPTPTPTSDVKAVAGGSGPATAALLALPMKGRAAKTGYSRDAFGPAWADVDGNGCDTRNDVLRRDLTATQTVAGTGGCEVATGNLTDPYSGSTIAFTRGAATSTAVQIDHVVALSDAWQTGAFTWTPDKREAFANDPLNLLAVQGSLNEAKGDGDAATWLPPDKTERCAYVARQVAVKTAYALWVTPAEHQATTRILNGCPDQTLPTETSTTPPFIDPAAALTAPTPVPAPRIHPSTAPPVVVAPIPAPVPTRTKPQPRRTEPPVPPGGGATALCKDGTLSYAQHHQGACSHHGGVETFYK